ncbi:MAG: class I SAM-dependent methyltransferase [Nitrospirae bacterium]|nr:class I SAM-dependent methyltransferase [Nitrospirota bacterium]
MKPTATVQQPLALTEDLLGLRAWRMPDLVAYQRSDDEWWVAPLEDSLPLLRLNRAGIELLTSMDGHTTLGGLLNKYGSWVCGPDGQTGRWHLERWSLPGYSLCYFGSEPPSADRHGAKWDLLLQQIREGWSGKEGFEGEEHLSGFHLHDITNEDQHFDTIETTVSHLFREPSEALQGMTYGRLLARRLRQLGWWTPKPRGILEVGGGLGYMAREIAAELSPEERQSTRYVFLDIAKPFLGSQLALAGEAGWNRSGTQANAEWLPFRDSCLDLVIDNENLADMTPVKLSRREMVSATGDMPIHQEAVDWIRRLRLPLDQDMPEEFMFNLGPIRFLSELWRVLRPGGHAILIEFGIEAGWPAPVKLPGHTEYEVQYTHLRHAARWMGFQQQYFPLPQFLAIRPDIRLLCTGATYSIQRFCEAEGKPFSIRAYTERELTEALGPILPKLMGCHYHEISDPAWFGLWDFKVLLLEKPGGAPRPSFRETKGFRWYSQR